MLRKRIFLLFIVIAWALSLSAGAEETDQNAYSSVHLIVNDHVLTASGTVVEGCTFVPLRAVIEAMGGSVHKVSAKKISATTSRHSALFTLDDRCVTIDRRRVLMYKAPQVIDDVVCVPLRFFVDSCGSRLDYCEQPKAVYLYSSDYRYTTAAGSPLKAVLFSPRTPLITGDTVNFEVLAAPASKITIDIPGVKNDIPTYEERPGRFLGSLIITESMRASGIPVTAKIGALHSRKSYETISINADGTTAVDEPLRFSPQNNSIIVDRHPNIVVAFADRSLQRDSIRLWFDEVEHSHQIHYRSNWVAWRPAALLHYGKHHVRFTALDMKGKTVAADWFFSVSPNLNTIPNSDVRSAPLLRIASPRSGDTVHDVFSVVGRATTGSTVTISVCERTGRLEGIKGSPAFSQTQTVEADLSGRFEVEFDISAVRAGHQILIEAQADIDDFPSDMVRMNLIRK